MKEIKKKLYDILPAYLYGIVITVVTMLPYIPNNYIVIIISVVAISLLYTLLLKFKTKKFLFVLMYFLSFLLIGFGFKMSIGGTGFYTWVLTGYDYNSMFIPYILLLFFACVLFFGVSSFYFTQFYFRGYIMIFMLMIPVALYYKMIENVPVIYIVAVVISLIFLYGVERQKINLSKKTITVNMAAKKFLAVIMCVIAFVAVITPKSDVAKYREVFDEIIAMNPFSNRNINDISQVSDKSAASSYPYLNQTRLVYTVSAYEPLYLKRSSFLKYEGDCFTNKSVGTDISWQVEAENNNMRTYYENMSYLYEMYPEIFEKYNVSGEDIPNVTEERMNAIVTPKKFNANYFLGTVRTYNVEKKYVYEEYLIGRNDYGCIKYKNGYNVGFETYTIEYYRDLARSTEEILSFASKFKMSDYLTFVHDLKDVCKDTEISEWLNGIAEEIEFNMAYNATNSLYAKGIKELALEITKDCETEYEKAVAIESYFTNNGYVYNIAAEPEDDSIEYFLFESKEGGCREFATAMTLMAQSIGLCARYTEGFLMDNTYSDGTYYITAGNSHAYVEIYIPGYGFTVFEPTIAAEGNQAEGIVSGTISRITNIIEVTADKVIYLVIVIVILVLTVVLFNAFLLDGIKNAYMVRRCIKSKTPTEKTYSYIMKIFGEYTSIPIRSMTPREVEEFARNRFDVDISQISRTVERKVYGEAEEEISVLLIKKLPEIKDKVKIKVKEEKKKTKKEEKNKQSKTK